MYLILVLLKVYGIRAIFLLKIFIAKLIIQSFRVLVVSCDLCVGKCEPVGQPIFSRK